MYFYYFTIVKIQYIFVRVKDASSKASNTIKHYVSLRG